MSYNFAVSCRKQSIYPSLWLLMVVYCSPAVYEYRLLVNRVSNVRCEYAFKGPLFMAFCDVSGAICRWSLKKREPSRATQCQCDGDTSHLRTRLSTPSFENSMGKVSFIIQQTKVIACVSRFTVKVLFFCQLYFYNLRQFHFILAEKGTSPCDLKIDRP